MNCTELKRALADAMNTGKLGTPVVARVHVQLASPTFAATTCGLPGVIDGVLQMLSPAFCEPFSSLRVRRHMDVEQCTLLLQTPTGKTVCITVGCGSRSSDSLELLVVGNHGTAKLHGEEPFDWQPENEPEFDWSSAIDEAVTTGREISLGERPKSITQ